MTESAPIEGTPGWLKPNDDVDEERVPPDSVEDTDTGIVKAADENANDSSSPQQGTPPHKSQSCKKLCISAPSTLILILFIYATIVQGNDTDKLKWSFFYGLQAVIPAIFLVHYLFHTMTACCSVLEKVTYVLSTGMIIWSIVFIILISGELEDESDADLREELIFELSGVVLGLVSAVYHIILTFRRGRGNVKQHEGRDEEE